MLSKVSWSEFVVVVGILLVVYYLFVAATYYREEIKQLLSGKLPKKDGTPKKGKFEKTVSDLQDSAAFDELEAVVFDLRHAILDKAGKQTSKPALLGQLQQRLATYSGLGKPAYRVAINNYIIVNAKEICGIAFSADELNEAWDAVSR